MTVYNDEGKEGPVSASSGEQRKTCMILDFFTTIIEKGTFDEISSDLINSRNLIESFAGQRS